MAERGEQVRRRPSAERQPRCDIVRLDECSHANSRNFDGNWRADELFAKMKNGHFRVFQNNINHRDTEGTGMNA